MYCYNNSYTTRYRFSDYDTNFHTQTRDKILPPKDLNQSIKYIAGLTG